MLRNAKRVALIYSGLLVELTSSLALGRICNLISGLDVNETNVVISLL